MPLETATYIADLNSSNPAATDSPAQADDHLRLIKGALKAQFPNFTSAASVATNAALDAAAAAVTNGAAILADAGAFFKTNTTDGITNPVAGEVDVKCGGNIVTKHKSDLSTEMMGALKVDGSLTVTGAITGPGSVITGATMVWWTNTLPTGYLWCNGQTVSRTTYAALFTIFGTFYGAGDGSTTFGLPDLRENAPVGNGTMGGTSSPGRITNWATNAVGSFIGACLHVLTTGELPVNIGTAATTVAMSDGGNAVFSGGGGLSGPGNGSRGTTTLSATASTTLTNAIGGNGHDSVQPSVICNWIIKT